MAECNCGNDGIKLFYACSGAANTGLLADQAARELAKANCGKMTCLAATGAGLAGFIESAKCARNILLDGCPVSCGKLIFEKLRLPYTQYIMTDFGVEKGKTEITPGIVEKVAGALKEKIHAR